MNGMNSLVTISIAAIALLAALPLLLRLILSGSGRVGFPYVPARELFTPAERAFLGVLDNAVGPEFRVFGKVRIGDVAAVRPGLGEKTRIAAFNRIACKHFDFVVCRAADLSIVCAVELNDSSHMAEKARKRDAFVNDVCKAIRLPLLTVPARKTYSAQEIRTNFLEKTGAREQ